MQTCMYAELHAKSTMYMHYSFVATKQSKANTSPSRKALYRGAADFAAAPASVELQCCSL